MSRDDDAPRSAGGRDVPNHMVLAVLSVLCPCWPLGLVAIIKAASVNRLVSQGDYAAAEKASADAKKFAMISIILGVISYVLVVILWVTVFAAMFAVAGTVGTGTVTPVSTPGTGL